jgi:hypothetical protein
VDEWAEKLSCALSCQRCNRDLTPEEPRILSVYDHEAICMACKKKEEKRPDYEEMAKRTIGQCLIDTEIQWGDPEGYCYHHFYTFTCK